MSFYKKTTAFLFPFWAGLITAISFLEAWLKFRAEGVTREIGLSIGSLVFTALNRIEIVILLIILVLHILRYKRQVFNPVSQNIMVSIISFILILQTIWLLPGLIGRAEQIIAGSEPSYSPIHLIYGLLEALKLILLIALSINVIRNNEEVTEDIVLPNHNKSAKPPKYVN